MKIAICDDSNEFIEVLKEMLEDSFCVPIYCFPCVKDCIKSEQLFDVIISDYDFGSYCLSTYLDKIDRTKLIVLTGSDEILDIDCRAIFNKYHLYKYKVALPILIQMILNEKAAS